MKILVVDDHAMLRLGISALLARAETGSVVLEAADCAAGLELAARTPDLDVVLLDLALPGTGSLEGLEALKAFGRALPGLPVIVLTALDNPELARQAFATGALGYVPKSASSEILLTALRLVLQGEIFVPSLMVRAPERDAAAAALTDRQIEILRRLDEGLSNKAIAQRLGISEKTVKGHVTGLLRALSVTDRKEAIRAARANGLLQPGRA